MRKSSRIVLSWIETWQFALTGLSALFVASIVISTAQDLSEVSSAKAQVEGEVARVIADDHAHRCVAEVFAVADGGGVDPGMPDAVGDHLLEVVDFVSTAAVSSVAGGGAQVRLSVAAPSGQGYRFECDVLGGSVPLALRRGVVVGGELQSGQSSAEAADWLGDILLDSKLATGLKLDERVVAESKDSGGLSNGESRASFVRDDSIALLRLKRGSDQLDYRFAPEEDGVARPWFGGRGVLILDGNLWVAEGDGPLVVEIESTSTLVVNGNCYIERSIRVVTRNRGADAELLIVVLPQPDTRWSEGCGQMIFGRNPKEDGRRVVSDRPLRIGASLAAFGSSSVFCPVDLEAALVVHGDLELGPAAQLRSLGTRLLDSRCRVPAVVTDGIPRPGRMVAVRRDL